VRDRERDRQTETDRDGERQTESERERFSSEKILTIFCLGRRFEGVRRIGSEGVISDLSIPISDVIWIWELCRSIIELRDDHRWWLHNDFIALEGLKTEDVQSLQAFKLDSDSTTNRVRREDKFHLFNLWNHITSEVNDMTAHSFLLHTVGDNMRE
jgi:hypothetical protein